MRTARGEARGVLEEWIKRLPRVLSSRGRMVMLSPAPQATAQWGLEAGLRLEESIAVRLGGMVCELQRFS